MSLFLPLLLGTAVLGDQQTYLSVSGGDAVSVVVQLSRNEFEIDQIVKLNSLPHQCFRVSSVLKLTEDTGAPDAITLTTTDGCPHGLGDGASLMSGTISPEEMFKRKLGRISNGEPVGETPRKMTFAEAKKYCADHPECRSFEFKASKTLRAEMLGVRADMHFRTGTYPGSELFTTPTSGWSVFEEKLQEERCARKPAILGQACADGSTLNAFSVLQVPVTASTADIKKAYKKLSLLVRGRF
jgi:hypothetical protein